MDDSSDTNDLEMALMGAAAAAEQMDAAEAADDDGSPDNRPSSVTLPSASPTLHLEHMAAEETLEQADQLPQTSVAVDEPSEANGDDDGSASDNEFAILQRPKKLTKEQLKLLQIANAVRRSDRRPKQVQRLNAGATSDDDDPRSRRSRKTRKESDDWASAASSGASSSSASGDEEGWRPTPRTRQARGGGGGGGGGGRARARRRRRAVVSSDEQSSDDSDSGERRTRRAVNRKDVVYKEESSGGEVNSDDVLEWDEQQPTTLADADAADQLADTIQKVLKERVGRKGAVGHPTTVYNVLDRGDPNAGFDHDKEEAELHYLIKWVGWSHLHNTWESEASLQRIGCRGMKKLENYIKRLREIKRWKRSLDKESIEYFDCEQEMNEELNERYKEAERIVAHQKSRAEGKEDGTDYFVKWVGLPYAESTWEDSSLCERRFQRHIDEYHRRIESTRLPNRVCPALRRRPKFVPFETQPDFVGTSELVLRDYQLQGLQWLLQSWCRENSVILADEMGLGKTIQAISFASTLCDHYEVYGPFLFIVPLSTMAAWQREFDNWAPHLNTIIYLGDVGSRDLIRQYEWYCGATKRLKFNCALTTYEILLKDKAFLGSFEWAALIVDEAHRLKNDESLLYRTLIDFSSNHRLLITGTPLQNSLKELWALLHFIMPQKFNDWEVFEARHQGIFNNNRGYASLHGELEPFLLRRVKKDVEKSLPAKVEQILRVDMTAVQKQYYKWILTKNYRDLSKGIKGSITGFINIMMELKKCCNHAYLVRQPDDEPAEAQDRLQHLLKSSGKLILLDKLLCRLYETGHRVLIFSQMVMLLDILQEYLRLRRFGYQRLDGSMRADLRRQALDHFNAASSQDFCFLLSTRAGGLGINLATADTVIIFDSDWNPQNDLQAQSRAHRIGQTKQVNIYRFVTKGSVEETIVERAKQKLVLDHLVIQRMDTTGRTVLAKNAVSSGSRVPFEKQELAAILKFGAEELFKEKDEDVQEPEVDVDDILQRAETLDMADTSKNDLFAAFNKVANFAIDEEKDVGPAAVRPRDPSAEVPSTERDWDDIIPEHERRKIEAEEQRLHEAEMTLGPRQQRSRLQQMARNEDSDDDWASTEKRRQKRKRGSDSDSDSSDDERPPGKRAKKAVLGFTEAQVRKFVRSFRKFARPLTRLDAIACDAELEESSQAELLQLADELERGCKAALANYEQNGGPPTQDENDAPGKRKDRGPTFKFGGIDVYVRPLRRVQADLEPLSKVMPPTASERKYFKLPAKAKPIKNWDVSWDESDDAALLRGIFEYGMGSWESIKMDPELALTEKVLLLDKNKKPQAKHLQTRVDYLLKFLRQHLKMSGGGGGGGASKPPRHSNKTNGITDIVDTVASGSGAAPRDAQKKKRGAQAATTKARKGAADSESKGSQRSSTVAKGVKGDERKTKASASGGGETKAAPRAPKNVDIGQLDVLAKCQRDLEDASSEKFKRCVEILRPVQGSLKRVLNSDDGDDSGHHLLKVGDHICRHLSQAKQDRHSLEKWHSYLWIFISKFTDDDGAQLVKKYRKAAKSRRTADAPADAAAGKHHHHGSHHHHHKAQHRNSVEQSDRQPPPPPPTDDKLRRAKQAAANNRSSSRDPRSKHT